MVTFINQSNISSFSQAVVHPDVIIKPIVKLKRRYLSGGVNTYDADWATITNYLINLSDIKWGADDQPFVQGVTRIPNVDIIFNNINGAFRDNSDSNSLWFNSTTTYYRHKSLLEVDFKAELPTGTSYTSTEFTGLLRGDSFFPNHKKHTFKCTAFGLLESLKDYNIYDAFSYSRSTGFNNISIVDVCFNYLRSNLPSAIALTFTANNPREAINFNDIEEVNTDMYSFLSSMARQAGSLLGLNKNKEIFLTYFDNPYYADSSTTFTNDSLSAYYYLFDETSETANVVNTGYAFAGDINITGGDIGSLTSGRFGSGRLFSGQEARNNQGSATFNSLTAIYSAELLFRFSSLKNAVGDNRCIDITSSTGALVRLLDQGDGRIGLGSRDDIDTLQKKAMPFGENQWYYLAATDDGSARKLYLNGTQVHSLTGGAGSKPNMLIGPTSKFCNIEFDSIRISQTTRTEAEIKQVNANIFGNAFQWASIPAYTFYTHGKNKNCDIVDYNDGSLKIFNKVIIKNSASDIFRCEFALTPNQVDGTILRGRFGNKIFSSTALTSVTAIQTFFNGVSDNFYCTLTSNNFVIKSSKIDKELGLISFIGFNSRVDTVASSYYSLSADETYLSEVRVNSIAASAVVFAKDIKQSDFIFVNTSSVNQYGVSEYKLEGLDNINNNLEQVTLEANSILNNSAAPKDRIKIKALFLEGALNLFNRVTVNHEPDIYWDNQPLEWDVAEWDVSSYITDAGNITWTSKDFWVIGVTHSYNNNATYYDLREV